MVTFNYRKTVQALNLFADLEGGKINKMKALKLIWLSDRLHLRKYGRLITNDQYYALKNGPVASATRNILQEDSDFASDVDMEYSKEYIRPEGYDYCTRQKPNLKVFSETDLEVLKTIYDNFGKFGHFELSNLSHEFPEWKKFKFQLESGISSRQQIDLNDFFADMPFSPFSKEEADTELTKEIFELELL